MLLEGKPMTPNPTLEYLVSVMIDAQSRVQIVRAKVLAVCHQGVRIQRVAALVVVVGFSLLQHAVAFLIIGIL